MKFIPEKRIETERIEKIFLMCDRRNLFFTTEQNSMDNMYTTLSCDRQKFNQDSFKLQYISV
jgi:hypothetical protein